MITQELIKEYFDYKDGCLYAKKSRQGVTKGERAGRIVTNGYRYLNFLGKIYLEHRIIFLYHHGYLPKVLDHIDTDKTNNKIENLRAATHAQNAANMKTPKSNTSGIKGVCYDKARDKWSAELKVENKRYKLGRFKTKEEAAEKVREARIRLHKEFARHE